ncbi:hypothetical protein TNIN_341341, partial [Trichonephila inaurata madagascariensis]
VTSSPAPHKQAHLCRGLKWTYAKGPSYIESLIVKKTEP